MSMAEPSPLAPNLEDITRHLNLMFGHAREYDDGLVEIAVDTIGKGWQGQLFGTDQLNQAAAYAVKRNAEGCNVYVGAALRDPDTAPFGRASDDDHYATTVAGGDLDTEEASAAAPERTRKLPPSYIVCTGNHPYTRLQTFWMLREAITDKDQHRALFGGIADSLDGDRTVTNPGRVMRLAGTIAWPTKPGRVPELTYLVPLKYEPKLHDADAVAAAYPVSDKVHNIDAGRKNDPIERTGTGALGLGAEQITDGREAYMRDTILAVFIEFVGENGAVPTAQELFDVAWPQYSAHVDFSRPGRGPDEMARKIKSTLQRFNRGQLRGLPDIDAVLERYRSKKRAERSKPEPNKKAQAETNKPGEEKQAGPLFQRAAAFAKGWKPAEYLVDGIMQRGYCYSLTSPTGHGKTSVILNLAACIGTGRNFAGAETTAGKVGYFAAENPNDIQARWIGMQEALAFDDADVWFCPYTVSLENSYDQIRAEAGAAGGFDLIVVDTSQAFFGGDDENSNTQMVGHAKAMRKLTQLPGNPCVIILTHPVKNPSKDNLLPRGGGGFLAEVDGNLTIWNDSDNIVLHHQGKFRGAGFAPVNFVLKPVQPVLLKDAKGRQIPTVVAEHVTEEAYRKRLADNATDEDKVMILILSRKGDITFQEIAVLNEWVSKTGVANKAKVSRLIESLKKQKLVSQKRGGKLALTKAGKAEIGPKARAMGIDGAGEEDAEEGDFG